MNGLGATITPELLRDAEARRHRYAKLFATHALLDRTIMEIYHAHREKLRVRTRPEEVSAFLFGKATKTLDAIRVLCEGGFGQDAVILVRSLVNLVIDLWYIGGDPDERTKDYIANGLRTRRTFQDRFPGRSGPLPALGPDWDEVKERARRWKDVSIEIRAKGTPLEDTYHELYRFGSSLDHSDSWSANQYVASREGATFSINNGPSDDLVSIALGYALQAMIVLVEVLCRAFAITERTRLDVLLAEFKRLEKFNGPRET